jgi:hypothetical protein
MALFVPIVMFAWVPLVLAVFCLCQPRTAVLFALFGAWLFLPMAGYGLPGLPDYGKMTAGPFTALLGVLLFDAGRLLRLRLGLWDLPMLVVLVSPFISSMTAGYGIYDGLAGIVNVAAGCGIAYLLGRMYFNDVEGRRQLALAFFVAGLVYVPFCLYEIRLSPQLHQQVYGYAQHNFSQTYRMGGWRPMVFMQHGLAVGFFMAAAAVVGVWLWLTQQRRTLFGLPMVLWVVLLLVTAVLCKSAFALALLLVALLALLLVRATRWTAPILLLALLPAFYMVGRITGVIEGPKVLAALQPISGEQIGSLAVRIQSEEILIPLAMRHPLWGVSRWASLIEDSQGQRTDESDFGFKVVPDALWVLTLANRGVIGLAALVLVFFVPVLALLRRRGTSAGCRAFDPATGLAVVLVMHMADNLLNAMVSPVFWLMAGALTGMLLSPIRTRATKVASTYVPARRAWN